jgi:hypothetical protein
MANHVNYQLNHVARKKILGHVPNTFTLRYNSDYMYMIVYVQIKEMHKTYINLYLIIKGEVFPWFGPLGFRPFVRRLVFVRGRSFLCFLRRLGAYRRVAVQSGP